MTELKLLRQAAKEKLHEEFYRGEGADPDVGDCLDVFHRDGQSVDFGPLEEVINECLRRKWPRPSASDQWLAPRLHASLRLTRREASDNRLWIFLAVLPLRKYVLWRFPGKTGTADVSNFFGSKGEHAIARLWWGAELTRNGASYSATEKFFSNTDIPNSWLHTNLFRHRPTALACVKFIYELKVEGIALGDLHRDFFKAFNSALTTNLIDALAVSMPAEAERAHDWLIPAADLYKKNIGGDNPPEGPNESPVNPADIELIHQLLLRVSKKTNFKKRDKTKSSETEDETVVGNLR